MSCRLSLSTRDEGFVGDTERTWTFSRALVPQCCQTSCDSSGGPSKIWNKLKDGLSIFGIGSPRKPMQAAIAADAPDNSKRKENSTTNLSGGSAVPASISQCPVILEHETLPSDVRKEEFRAAADGGGGTTTGTASEVYNEAPHLDRESSYGAASLGIHIGQQNELPASKEGLPRRTLDSGKRSNANLSGPSESQDVSTSRSPRSHEGEDTNESDVTSANSATSSPEYFHLQTLSGSHRHLFAEQTGSSLEGAFERYMQKENLQKKQLQAATANERDDGVTSSTQAEEKSMHDTSGSNPESKVQIDSQVGQGTEGGARKPSAWGSQRESLTLSSGCFEIAEHGEDAAGVTPNLQVLADGVGGTEESSAPLSKAVVINILQHLAMREMANESKKREAVDERGLEENSESENADRKQSPVSNKDAIRTNVMSDETLNEGDVYSAAKSLVQSKEGTGVFKSLRSSQTSGSSRRRSRKRPDSGTFSEKSLRKSVCRALKATRKDLKAAGALRTTLSVAAIDPFTKILHTFTVGDSKTIVYRGGSIVFETSALIFEFNFPVQLTNRSKENETNMRYEPFLLEDGDVVITFSDGISDNLYKEEIVKCVIDAQSAGVNSQGLAEELCRQACAASKRTDGGLCPFSQAAAQRYLSWMITQFGKKPTDELEREIMDLKRVLTNADNCKERLAREIRLCLPNDSENLSYLKYIADNVRGKQDDMSCCVTMVKSREEVETVGSFIGDH